MDWKSVSETISRDDYDKWDRKVPVKNLALSESGALKLLTDHSDTQDFALSDTATLQLCQRLEIPVRYYRRLPREMQALVANYDLSRQNGKSFFLRGMGQWVRAFLSDEYVAYNNSEIAETVESLLAKPELTIRSSYFETSTMGPAPSSEELWRCLQSIFKDLVLIKNTSFY